MTRKLIALSLIQSIFSFCCAQTDKEILDKTISKLNSIKIIEYTVATRFTDKRFLSFDTATCYFDFTSNDTLLGAKYHFQNNQLEQVFNGKTAFSFVKFEERILYTDKPSLNILNSPDFMIPSIYTIKMSLPIFLKDTSIIISRGKDTLINGEKNYNFKISMKNAYLLGNFWKTRRYASSCNLIISQKSNLPVQFNNVFPNNKGYLNSSFSDLNLTTTRTESIWSFERFPEKNLRMTYEAYDESVKAKISTKSGEIAPEWKLPLVSGDSVRLSDLKGNLVLLEFFFPNCSGCVSSIPDINRIQDVYSTKGLKVYAIEFTRLNDKGLGDYIFKNKIKYPTLYSGIQVAKWYGINTAPSFFLIDKKGVILYSSQGLNKNDLERVIADNI